MDSFWITREELFAYMARQERMARNEDSLDITMEDIAEDVRGRLALFIQEAMRKAVEDEGKAV